MALAACLPALAEEGRNHLGSEKSPYLRQHAGNPVWWWTWTPDALATAKRQDKPIFLSIGYSTCHWCHVMERESFTKDDVAQLLNASFLAIKVDREERPDLDEIYVEAVEAMTGGAGWPATVILTPDGRPFLGGTYFPHDALVEMLRRVAASWKKDRAKTEATGAALLEELTRRAQREAAGTLADETLVAFEKAWERSFDSEHGGSLGAPKFPPSYAVRLLLRVNRRSGNPKPLEMATRTLDAMARGGIHDHVGGGFHRYSTDERWLVPHFEKMLYDQAALAQAYLEGFLATGDARDADVCRDVLDYVLRDMTSPEGGFYSAEDADSEGREGRFYVWSEAELRGLLRPDELEAVRAAFGVTASGNAPGHVNVLHRVDKDGASETLTRALAALRKARAVRVRPARDEKILADWNGLAIAALARAGRVLGEPRYVDAAARAARFLLATIARPDGTLLHRVSAGETRYTGNLDDYAFLIDGLLELYAADFDRSWVDRAAALQAVVESRFLSPRGNYYFGDGSDASLLVREVRSEDNVVPAGNSVEVLNLLRLTDLLADSSLAVRARAIMAATPRDVQRAPEAYPMLLIAADYALDRSKEVAVAGDLASPATRALVDAVRRGFNPNLVVAAGQPGPSALPLLADKRLFDDKPTAFVCEGQVCRAPTTDPAAAAERAAAFRPLAPKGR